MSSTGLSKQAFAVANVTVGLATKVIGLVGFEPTASWSRTRRSTKLSHSPSYRRGRLRISPLHPVVHHFVKAFGERSGQRIPECGERGTMPGGSGQSCPLRNLSEATYGIPLNGTLTASKLEPFVLRFRYIGVRDIERNPEASILTNPPRFRCFGAAWLGTNMPEFGLALRSFAFSRVNCSRIYSSAGPP